jgi:hypothetical protein
MKQCCSWGLMPPAGKPGCCRASPLAPGADRNGYRPMSHGTLPTAGTAVSSTNAPGFWLPRTVRHIVFLIVFLKEVDSPMTVDDGHWGGMRLAYKA